MATQAALPEVSQFPDDIPPEVAQFIKEAFTIDESKSKAHLLGYIRFLETLCQGFAETTFLKKKCIHMMATNPRDRPLIIGLAPEETEDMIRNSTTAMTREEANVSKEVYDFLELFNECGENPKFTVLFLETVSSIVAESKTKKYTG